MLFTGVRPSTEIDTYAERNSCTRGRDQEAMGARLMAIVAAIGGRVLVVVGCWMLWPAIGVMCAGVILWLFGQRLLETSK